MGINLINRTRNKLFWMKLLGSVGVYVVDRERKNERTTNDRIFLFFFCSFFFFLFSPSGVIMKYFFPFLYLDFFFFLFFFSLYSPLLFSPFPPTFSARGFPATTNDSRTGKGSRSSTSFIVLACKNIQT